MLYHYNTKREKGLLFIGSLESDNPEGDIGDGEMTSREMITKLWEGIPVIVPQKKNQHKIMG